MVRPTSIARWNEHKDVKEDKERDPHFFMPLDKSSDVDGKKKKKEEGFDLHSAMLANMALKSFGKRD